MNAFQIQFAQPKDADAARASGAAGPVWSGLIGSDRVWSNSYASYPLFVLTAPSQL
jgi:hypothetical protein